MFNALDQEVVVHVVELVRAIVKSLSFGLREATPNTPLSKFLKIITDACLKEVRELDGKSARPAGTILSACAGLASISNTFIIETCVPVLIVLFRENEDVAKRTTVLGLLNSLLDASKDV